MRIQDRQGRGPELLAAATDELVAAARKAPGLSSVFSPFTANTPQVFVDIDRRQGAEAWRADRECDRNDPDLFRLGLRQRLQPFRPHLPRHRAGGFAVSEGNRRSRAPAYPAMPPATWCCSVTWSISAIYPDRIASRATTCIRHRTAGRYDAGNEFGDRHRPP